MKVDGRAAQSHRSFAEDDLPKIAVVALSRYADLPLYTLNLQDKNGITTSGDRAFGPGP
jgi:hypothetical protein